MLEFLTVGFLTSAGLACAVTPLVRWMAPALGLIDLPGHRKVHVQPTPRGGGIAIFVALVVPVLLVVAAEFLGFGRRFAAIDEIFEEVSAEPHRWKQFAAIIAGAVLLFFAGLADDRWNLSWKARLAFQLSIAVGVVSAGVRATVFVDQPWFGFVATVLWILVLTNALNFLDNMDGLSAGIGLISSLIFAVILVALVKSPTLSVAFPLVLLAGSLVGFLVWNRPPASIFMGDCGSNLIGFLLAVLTVTGTFYESTGSRHIMLAPVCVMAVPLYDFCTVIMIRISQGRSPFHGDKSHFSHRLVEMGLRPAHAVLTIHLTTAMTGLGGLLLYKVQDWNGAMLVVALIFCVLAIISILETVGRRSVNEIQGNLAEARSMNSAAVSSPVSASPEPSVVGSPLSIGSEE